MGAQYVYNGFDTARRSLPQRAQQSKHAAAAAIAKQQKAIGQHAARRTRVDAVVLPTSAHA